MPAGPPPLTDVSTPLGQRGLTAWATSRPGPLALAARLGARLAEEIDGPWRVGKTVIVAAHRHVEEVLARDLDFLIAPINAERIKDVAGSFVLGMDRHPTMIAERQALYQAFQSVDFERLRLAAVAEAHQRTQGTSIDAVGDVARPVAAATAQRLFGIAGSSDQEFQDVSRAIFGHTFLNLSGDKAIRERAVRAANLLEQWLDEEIRRRRASGNFGTDMMGFLLRQGKLNNPGIRRTLSGMLVGSVDTTATAVAKILYVVGNDRKLMAQIANDLHSPARLEGWCLEALRRWPHNFILFRQAARNTALGGTPIRSKDKLILWTQAAMLDAGAFPEPEILRPDRPRERYLHYGGALHSCAGRSVNSWQIPLLVGAVLRRGITRVGKMAWAGPFPHRLRIDFQ